MQQYKTNSNIDNKRKWINVLTNFCLGFRSFSGRPFAAGETSSLYINQLGIRNGHAFAFKVDGKLYITYAGRVKYDYMYQPAEIIQVNPYIANGKEIKRTIHKDAVYIPLAPGGKTIKPLIQSYADRLARYEDDLYMNSIFMRSQKLFKCRDDAAAQKVRVMFDDLISGKVGILVDDDMFSELMGTEGSRGIMTLSDGFQWLGDEYLGVIRETLREFSEIMGIDNSGANLIKKERNTSGEVDSNNAYINVFKNSFNWETQRAIDEINELFNEDITVKWNGVTFDESEGNGQTRDMGYISTERQIRDE